MAKKLKTTKKTKAPEGDRRVTLISGVVLLLIALYLFIAFSSYVFTWKADQDQVLSNSWSLIFDSSVSVQNWIGRLGALVSNFFFYWGFGVASFLFIPLIFQLARCLIQKKSSIAYLLHAQKNFLVICFLSVLLAFIFQKYSFPWGGAFGSNLCFWLSDFVGNIGLSFLLLSIILSWAIWKFNPSIESLSLSTPLGALQLPAFLRFKSPDFAFWKTTDQTATKQPTNQTQAGLKTSTDRNMDIQERSGALELELPETMVGEPSRKNTKPFESIDGNEFGISSSSKNSDDIDSKLASIALEKTPKSEQIRTGLDIEESDGTKLSSPFDPTLELSSYVFPPVELLSEYSDQKVEIDRVELEANKDQIIRTLLNYKIEITKIRATIGPTITLYEIVPAPGVKISKIKNLEDDIALSLAALGIRIIAPIPGRGTIGIEVPNQKKQIVSFREVINSDKFQNSGMDLPIALGKTISNEVFVADLAKMPHLLIAGATGQGKSVGINAVIMSILYKKHPSTVKLVLIDPKKVELFPYAAIYKHYLAYLPNESDPIVTETSKVIYTLNSLCIEMDQRYDLLKKARSRNIKEYNEKFTERKLNPLNGHKFMPFIVLVIDEFADLIMTAGKEIELPIARIAQLARAVGIHLIIATQRPSVNIITGVIKANFPARIAFKVTSKIDSRTILDTGGADQLIGRGDMLLSVGGNIVRMQCAFVDTPEVEEVIAHIANQQGFAEPFYLPEYTGEEMEGEAKTISLADLDENFWDAAALVVANQSGSTSMLQRKLQLGYNRAGRIMDQMEAMGIVGENQGSKPREVLYFGELELISLKERLLNGN